MEKLESFCDVTSAGSRLVTGRYVLGVLYGEIGQNPKIEQLWRPVAPQPYIIDKSWPTSETVRTANNILSAVHPVTCSHALSVRCLFDRFSILDFGGKWPIKWKFSDMSFRIPRRDTELRFVAKFGGSRPLRSCRKVAWFTKQKKTRAPRATRPSRHFGQNGPIAPKIPWTLSPIDLHVHVYRIWSGSLRFAGLIPERLLFRPKKSVQYRLSAYS